MKTSKDSAQDLTMLLKTHHIVSMRINANNQFCFEMTEKNGPIRTVAMTMDGVEEILKFGFAARSLFP